MLIHEKADQAQALLAETGLDCWLTFVRETTVRPDPGVGQVVGADLTWDSAFLFGRGERIAIVGRYDAPNIRAGGVFQEVISYDEGIGPALVDSLDRLDPQRIGLNYSDDDPTADGLTYGMLLHLNDLLSGTPYGARLTSAAPLLSKLRARKSPTEVARIRAAIATTEEIVGLVAAQIRPGVSEAQLGAFIHEQFRARGLPSASGVRGYEIDEIAREVIVDAGYEEYKHAFGHGLGRACHDGGTLLGPRWPRYGATPEGIVEAGNVFTLELGVETEAGYVGVEEDVLVTENGCEFLSSFQRALMMI